METPTNHCNSNDTNEDFTSQIHQALSKEQENVLGTNQLHKPCRTKAVELLKAFIDEIHT